ncbi:MAG: hypothetical protein DRP00_02950 [Candidatus Aenigmatarchaeota archaeon]|nr:MAG: hypothetical protein DRP00_02950 [Candidatus Aenigmarchaeota archaeon]
MRVGDVLTKMVEIAIAPLQPIADAINNFIKDFANTLKDGLKRFLSSVLLDDLNVIEDVYERIFGECPQINELWKKEKENIKKGETGAIQLLGLIASSAIGTGIGMGLSGFGQDIQNFFNSIHPVTPLPPDILAYGKHTGKITDDMFKTDLLSQGYSDDKHEVIYDYYKPKLTVTELLEAERRIDNLDYDVNSALKEHGLNDKEIEILRKLSYAYPSPTDFIRFAVREVFTDDKETQEALRAEFPDNIVEYAKKAGMDKDVLMWYWMSHWELPSPTQVYEMLHRLNPEVLSVRGKAYEEMGLDLEQLKTDLRTVEFYLKQADYDKRWRQRLLAISYSPITRVDLRRIYELGLIDDNELLARLMEIGYTKADAQKLVEFYKTYKVSEEKDLTRTQILQLWSIGEITDKECKEMLMRLGYDDVEAEFLITLEKYKLAEKELNDMISVYVYQFEEGLISEEELVAKLDELGIRATRRDKIVVDAVRRRNRKIRLPSKEDIVKWYKQKLITEEKARELLSRINIPEEFHDLYLGKKK